MSTRKIRITTACESYLNAPIGDEGKHKTEYVQYQTLRGKVITVCKHCKAELEEFKMFLRAMNGLNPRQGVVSAPLRHGETR